MNLLDNELSLDNIEFAPVSKKQEIDDDLKVVGTSKLYVNNIIKESARVNSVIKIDELQSNELSENSYEIVCKLIDDEKGSETDLDLVNNSSHHHTPVKFNREAIRNVNPAMNQASRKTYAYEVRKSQNDALKMNPYAKKSIAQ